MPSDNLYSGALTFNLERISDEIVPKVKNWPPSFAMVRIRLAISLALNVLTEIPLIPDPNGIV